MARKNDKPVERAVKKGKQKIKEAKKVIKSQLIQCQICGRKTENPVDAMTHLLDHGASALEGVSKLIKDQKEGKVSKVDRESSSKPSSVKEVEVIEA